MISKVYSAALSGIESFRVTIEVDSFPTLEPSFQLVGLPDTAVREAKDRIKSACFNSGYSWPDASFTINLAPADRRKEGSGFDLSILLGILGSSGHLGTATLEGKCFVGELSLSGEVRPAPRTEQRVSEAARLGFRRIVVSGFLRKGVKMPKGIEVVYINNIGELPRALFCEEV